MPKRKTSKTTKPARGNDGTKSSIKSTTNTTKAPQGSTRAGTKQDAVIKLLSQPKGTTIAAITRATGWQQHSVRGFFAGVVRKKLGLKLVSDKTDSERLYRIVAGKA